MPGLITERNFPTSWTIKRFKYCAQICNGGEYSDIEVEEGGYPVIGSGGEFARASKFSYCEKSVLLGRKGTVDKPLFVDGAFWCVDTMFYTKIKDFMYEKYLYYCALCFPFDYYVTSTALPSMTQRDLGSQEIAVPPKKEQKAIADFLDKECAQIDSIAADLEKQIELLQQYKQSLITETVTKGLDKSVPMKDSGVEWIGEIPYDWKAIRFRYVFSLDKGLTITKEDLVDDGVPVISYGQVHAKTNTGTGINDSLIRYVPELYLGTDRQSLAYQGNYIFADTSEDLGGVGNCVFIDINGALFAGYHTIISRIKGNSSEYFPKYFSYLFLSDMWRDQLRSKVMGVKVYSISQKLLKDTSILLPPKIIQQAIADYLDEKCATINSILDDKQAQLKVIQQHKKSLIYEYVTGKKRVKEVQ